jgi:hypothetical protein
MKLAPSTTTGSRAWCNASTRREDSHEGEGEAMAETTLLTDASRKWFDALNHGMDSYLSTLSSLTDQATKMMPSFREGPTADIKTVITEAGETWISTMEQIEGVYVNALSFWSELSAASLPTLPALPIPGFPDPEALVNTCFDLAEQLIAVQRSSAHKVFEAMAPMASKWAAGAPTASGSQTRRASGSKAGNESASAASQSHN